MEKTLFKCGNCGKTIFKDKAWTCYSYPDHFFHSLWCLFKYHLKRQIKKRGFV